MFGDVQNFPDLYFNFVSGLGEDLVLDLLVNTTIPLISGFITAATDQKFLDDILSPVCDVVGFIEIVYAWVDDIVNLRLPSIDGKLINDLGKKFTDLFKDIGKIPTGCPGCNCGRRLDESQFVPDLNMRCSGHSTPCGKEDDINRSCYQPVTELDGICLPTLVVESIDAGEIPEDVVQELNAVILSSNVESKLDERAIRGFEQAFGASDGLSIARIIMESLEDTKAELKSDIQWLQEDVGTRISEAEKTFADDVKEQCSSTTPPPFTGDEAKPKHRLRVDRSKLNDSKSFNKARDTASQFGVDESEVFKMFDLFIDTFSDESTATAGVDLQKELAKAIQESDLATKLSEMVDSEKESIMDDITRRTLLETFGGSSRRRGLNPVSLPPTPLKTKCNSIIDTGIQAVSERSL